MKLSEIVQIIKDIMLNVKQILYVIFLQWHLKFTFSVFLQL